MKPVPRDTVRAEDQTEPTIALLNERSREIFRHIVDAFVESGEPIGSRTIARRSELDLSPATIRNVMQDLEEMGLLFAPHTSAGRLPTEMGLRLFVHGLMEVGNVAEGEQKDIDALAAAAGRSVPQVMEEATSLISGLSHCAGLVIAPKTESPLKHIEFVALTPGRALVVMVMENGVVENRIVDVPHGTMASTLVEATNYLTSRLVGRTLEEARLVVQQELEQHRAQLDALASRVVEAGLATWGDDEGGSLIIRGQANLLGDVTAIEDLERIRKLFETLETKEGMLRLIDRTQIADGVQIFIGAENELFAHAGSSMVLAPFHNSPSKLVGAIGVIGPTRMNYARIVPLVDYTAKVVGRMIA